MRKSDIMVENYGSIFLFRPQTERARLWIEDHVDPGAQWLGRALAVEARYAGDLAQGMQEEGLTLK